MVEFGRREVLRTVGAGSGIGALGSGFDVVTAKSNENKSDYQRESLPVVEIELAIKVDDLSHAGSKPSHVPTYFINKRKREIMFALNKPDMDQSEKIVSIFNKAISFSNSSPLERSATISPPVFKELDELSPPHKTMAFNDFVQLPKIKTDLENDKAIVSVWDNIFKLNSGESILDTLKSFSARSKYNNKQINCTIYINIRNHGVLDWYYDSEWMVIPAKPDEPIAKDLKKFLSHQHETENRKMKRVGDLLLVEPN